jgi:hypothetical protein
MSSAAAPRSTASRRLDVRLPARAPKLAFAAVLVLGAAIIVHETRGMSFFGDEWDYVLDRRGMALSTLLRPHGPHLTLVPILIYKVLLAVFGGRSYLPFRLLAALDLVMVAGVAGIACRQRWGRWWGLVPVLLLVTLGQGAVTLLWPFQVGYSIAVAAGLASLLLIEVDTRRADLLACGALALSLASGSQGIGFVAGAAVMMVLRPNWRRRCWVFIVPAVLYGLWYLHYGKQYSETHLSLWPQSLAYFMQSLSATLGALVGLGQVSSQTQVLDLTYGVPLSVVALLVLGVALWRGWRPGRVFWGVAATLTVIWIAASVSNFGVFSRPPNDPRYVSSNAALVLVCICAAVPRPGGLTRPAIVAVALIVLIVSATNVMEYRLTRGNYLTSDIDSRAELGALLILRHVVAPTFAGAVPGDPSQLDTVQVGPFYSADAAFGIQADSPNQLLAQTQNTRELADSTLQRGGVAIAVTTPARPAAPGSLTILGGTSRPSGGCRILTAGPLDLQTHGGSYQISAPRTATVSITMGRFATGFASQIARVPARGADLLTVAPDSAPQVPWRIRLLGTGGRVCAG